MVDQEVDGWYTVPELALLVDVAAQAPEDGAFVEVGVYKGRSARVLDKARTRTRSLFLIDNFAMETACMDTWPPAKDGCRHMIRTPAEWEWGPIALFHQDADHSYETVLDHLETFGPHVVKGGFICLHDFEDPTYPGVKRAWEIYSENEDFQPYGRAGHLAVFRRTK